jgi:hypothetical protein
MAEGSSPVSTVAMASWMTRGFEKLMIQTFNRTMGLAPEVNKKTSLSNPWNILNSTLRNSWLHICKWPFILNFSESGFFPYFTWTLGLICHPSILQASVLPSSLPTSSDSPEDFKLVSHQHSQKHACPNTQEEPIMTPAWVDGPSTFNAFTYHSTAANHSNGCPLSSQQGQQSIGQL